MNRAIQTALAAAALVCASWAANATIFIGLQQDAGPIVTVSSNAGGFALFAGAFGEFETIAATGFGQPATVPPLLLQGGTLQANNAGGANAGTLTVYLTSTGNTSPLAATQFTSGFATVDLTTGWTETFETYLDPSNGVFALTTLLGSAIFSTVDSEVDITAANTGAGPFSVTAVVRIVAPTLGGASGSVGLNGVAVTTPPPTTLPEPASLSLLGVALGALGFAGRRKQ